MEGDSPPRIVPLNETEEARAEALRRLREATDFIVITSSDKGERWNVDGAWFDFTMAYGATLRYFQRLEIRQMISGGEGDVD